MVTDPSRKRAELPSDFPISDDGAYDDVVARDRRPGGSAEHGSPRVSGGSDDAARLASHTDRGQQQQQARPQVATPTHEPQPHVQQQQPHAQQQQQQQQQQGAAHPTVGSSGAHQPVTAGPIEADRETESRREAAVTAPSLAVGSRIESDRTLEDRARNVVEPGATAVPHAVIEPASHTPVVQHAPIPVVHTEPDAQQAQRGAQVQAPVLTGPRESDSTPAHAPVRAPDDTQRASNAPHPTSGGTPAGSGSGSSGAQQAVPQPVTAPPPVVHAPKSDTAPDRHPNAKGMYALEAVDIDGKTRPLSEFAGKVTLVVNVASACGYTDENYKGLMKTYEKYRNHGFEILGFPCNQFGKQEPGSEAEIKGFCSSRYHVTFPMFSKVDVNGPSTHPVYQFLKRELPEAEGGGGGKGSGKDLIWNFQKILVNHEGRPVKLFYQSWDQGAVEQEIYRLLHEARAAKAVRS